MEPYPPRESPWPDKDHPYSPGDNDGGAMPPVKVPEEDGL